MTTSVWAQDCVILLHGLARSSGSMDKLEQHLDSLGFAVVNQDYPSTKHSVAKLTDIAIPPALELCDEKRASRTHFVSHSLGGILIRKYLGDNKIENLGRVVMLAPPNKGSEAADKLSKLPPYQWLNGPAGNQLGTNPYSTPNQLGAANFEVGIIAGNKTVNPILSQLLPNPDDGKVSVERTKLEGMTDFIVVEHSHTFIMQADDVIEEVTHFLKLGVFSESAHKATRPEGTP